MSCNVVRPTMERNGRVGHGMSSNADCFGVKGHAKLRYGIIGIGKQRGENCSGELWRARLSHGLASNGVWFGKFRSGMDWWDGLSIAQVGRDEVRQDMVKGYLGETQDTFFFSCFGFTVSLSPGIPVFKSSAKVLGSRFTGFP